ncbi:MAG: 6-bladed beta-propeller [Acidobacteriota bacterium]
MKNIFIFFILIITFFVTLTGKVFILGSSSQDEQIVYPGKILEGPDNNIYIYDSQDAFIKIFSPDGKFIRKFGGKGEGPGQVKRADGLNFGFTPDGNQLYFTEYFRGHNWITFLDLSGKLRNTLKYNFGGTYGISGSFIFNKNLILLQKERPGKVTRKGDIFFVNYISEIIIIDSKGGITSTVLRRENPQTISFIRMGGDTGIPFSPEFLWEVTKGGEIVFTDGTTDKLGVYSRDGKLKKRIVVPVGKPEPVTIKDLDEWRTKRKESYKNRKKSWYKQFGSVIEKYTSSVFKYKPVIFDMSLTPVGNILLKCLTEKKDSLKYLLIDQNGKLLTELISHFSEIKITENYLIVRSENDDEEAIILLIDRSGEDKKDLEKLKNINK